MKRGSSEVVRGLIGKVDEGRLRRDVYYLAKSPLPRRTANFTLPGHKKSTLEEADDYLVSQLEAAGWAVERKPYQVQAFRRNLAKNIHHQYDTPAPEAPWYTAWNVEGRRKGSTFPEETLVLVAHKDSQSWIASPGAYDNAVGTAANLEIARVLAEYEPRRSWWLLFCNEEHTPWTSYNAASEAKARGENCVAIFNSDSLGGKGQEAAGTFTNVTGYCTSEGRALAELMQEVVARYELPLEQRAVEREFPNDDDGMFVKAGYPAAIVNVGSFPYADECYHLECDTADRVDYANVKVATQAILAALVELDRN